jgi:UDP-N-acetylglucosamine 2-epimerase (non-hydrolysing)
MLSGRSVTGVGRRSIRLVGVVGARPNFVKMAPIFEALERRVGTFETRLVHTGQHYDPRLSNVFFRELSIREPDVNLEVGSGPHGEQTAKIIVGIERLLIADRPDVVLVVGDVNSTLAAALAAVKLGIPVAHVEAGLRSRDRTMPEEINRIVTDTISDYLFTSSRDADENLAREGIEGDRVFFVGNVMIDTLLRCRTAAARSKIHERLGLERRKYALLTLHRPSNVDLTTSFSRLLDALDEIQRQLPIVFPLHPRTEVQLQRTGLSDRVAAMSQLRMIPPQSYLDFLALEADAKFVLTDSGGVQEETTVLGVPCLTLRTNTERPVTLTHGTSTLVGNDPQRIVAEAGKILRSEVTNYRIPEFWDGHAAERIADILQTRCDAAGNGVHL